MSFWDNVPDTPEGDNFNALIAQNPPDIEKILGHPEVLPSFRVKDSPLKRILTVPTNIQKNVKLSKTAIELYVASQSPLLLQLVTDPKLGESFIQRIEGSDLVRSGFVSRVFQHALQTLKPQTLSFFENSPLSLITLTKSANISAVSDLLELYLLQLPFASRWYFISILKIFVGSDLSLPATFAQFEGKITQVSSQVAVTPLTVIHKSNLLKLVKSAITGFQAPDVQSAVTLAIPVIFKNHAEEPVRILALKLGTVLPRHKEVIKLAAEVAKLPLPWTELSLTGLDILCVEPNKSYRTLCGTILERFIADQTNSIFHVKFLKFVKAAIEVPDLCQKFLETLPQVIVKGAQASQWRKAAGKVGVLMELALVIDPHFANPTAEWLAFRNGAIKKWETRNADAGKERKPATGGPRIIDDGTPAPVRTQVAEPTTAFGEVPASKKSGDGGGFGDFPAFEQKKSTGGDEFGSFPAFETPKEESPGFGGFPTFEESKPQGADSGFGSFPKFDEPKADVGDSGFGGFPTFDQPKEEDSGFGGFPKFDEPKADVGDSGFGGFPTFDQPKEEDSGFGGFPKFDEPKADVGDSGFGGFPQFDEAKAEGGDSGFAEVPKFGERKEEDSAAVRFPTFEEPVADGKSSPKAGKTKPEVPTVPTIAPSAAVSSPKATPSPPLDLSFGHFLELINHPCWDYTGPSPAELFGQKDRFSTVEEAFAFLVTPS